MSSKNENYDALLEVAKKLGNSNQPLSLNQHLVNRNNSLNQPLVSNQNLINLNNNSLNQQLKLTINNSNKKKKTKLNKNQPLISSFLNSNVSNDQSLSTSSNKEIKLNITPESSSLVNSTIKSINNTKSSSTTPTAATKSNRKRNSRSKNYKSKKVGNRVICTFKGCSEYREISISGHISAARMIGHHYDTKHLKKGRPKRPNQIDYTKTIKDKIWCRFPGCKEFREITIKKPKDKTNESKSIQAERTKQMNALRDQIRRHYINKHLDRTNYLNNKSKRKRIPKNTYSIHDKNTNSIKCKNCDLVINYKTDNRTYASAFEKMQRHQYKSHHIRIFGSCKWCYRVYSDYKSESDHMIECDEKGRCRRYLVDTGLIKNESNELNDLNNDVEDNELNDLNNDDLEDEKPSKYQKDKKNFLKKREHYTKIAKELAIESQTEFKWKQLAELALSLADINLAKECLENAQDLPGLLLLATSLGDSNLVERISHLANEKDINNISFLANFILGDKESALENLIKTDRLPEAAFFARTYLPSQVGRIINLWKESVTLKSKNEKQAQALANPFEYENLFPDFAKSLAAEKLYKETTKNQPRPKASEYLNIIPNIERNLLEEIEDITYTLDEFKIDDSNKINDNFNNKNDDIDLELNDENVFGLEKDD